MSMIFETDKFEVNKLKMDDLEPFHEMQSNIKVMQFVKGRKLSLEENIADLKDLIKKYEEKNNNFWIFAVRRKEDLAFVGTVALIKDQHDEDELGYRLLEKYWGNGYASEIVEGLIQYAQDSKMPSLIGYVDLKNKASIKILEKSGFKHIEDVYCEELNCMEHKFRIQL